MGLDVVFTKLVKTGRRIINIDGEAETVYSWDADTSIELLRGENQEHTKVFSYICSLVDYEVENAMDFEIDNDMMKKIVGYISENNFNNIIPMHIDIFYDEMITDEVENERIIINGWW